MESGEELAPEQLGKHYCDQFIRTASDRDATNIRIRFCEAGPLGLLVAVFIVFGGDKSSASRSQNIFDQFPGSSENESSRVVIKRVNVVILFGQAEGGDDYGFIKAFDRIILQIDLRY